MNNLFFSLLHTAVRNVLKKKELKQIALLFCSIFIAEGIFAQVSVKGSITNQSGEPIAGASVTTKGSDKGTTSQSNGTFEVVVRANSTLAISYVGYITKEVKVGSSNIASLPIQLLENKNALDQVIVVGYGTRRKSDVTGAITSISEQSIRD